MDSTIQYFQEVLDAIKSLKRKELCRGLYSTQWDDDDKCYIGAVCAVGALGLKVYTEKHPDFDLLKALQGQQPGSMSALNEIGQEAYRRETGRIWTTNDFFVGTNKERYTFMVNYLTTEIERLKHEHS